MAQSNRILALLCAMVNHYPRFPTGSWCWGYDYVCDRCGAYVDPWPPKKQEVMNRTAASLETEEEVQQYLRRTFRS